jgi:uncharacterized membrane protein YagU involved in acid resistance
MAETATTTEARTGIELPDWQAGTVAGVAGGVVMAVMLTMQMTPVIEHAIPAMYGLDGGLAGWIVHVSHAAVLGVGFAVAFVGAGATDASTARTAAAGLAYGVVLWVVLAVLVMPVWLDVVGFANAPALPNVNVQSLVGHVVYGAVTGVAFAALD